MKLLLTLIAILSFTTAETAFWDLCNGYKYTAADNFLLSSDQKDNDNPDPRAFWIYCTDEKIDTTPGVMPSNFNGTMDINGTKYKFDASKDGNLTALCVPFGEKHYIGESKNTYWHKCRRYPTDWAKG